MILFFGMLCLAMAAATLCPGTPPGRFLRRLLIDTPAEALSAKGLGKLGVLTIVLVGLLAIVAAPELLAVVAIADLTLYVEVVGIALLLGAGGRVKGVTFAVVRIMKAAVRPVLALRRRSSRRAPARPAGPARQGAQASRGPGSSRGPRIRLRPRSACFSRAYPLMSPPSGSPG